MPLDGWTTYHGDYSGRHYSPLKRLNAANLKQLSLAWTYRVNQSPQGAQSGGSVD